MGGGLFLTGHPHARFVLVEIGKGCRRLAWWPKSSARIKNQSELRVRGSNAEADQTTCRDPDAFTYVSVRTFRDVGEREPMADR
jgi:hypothetical protein